MSEPSFVKTFFLNNDIKHVNKLIKILVMYTKANECSRVVRPVKEFDQRLEDK